MGIRIHHPPSAVNDLPPSHYCDCQCPGCNDHSADDTPALNAADINTKAWWQYSVSNQHAERAAFKAGAEWAIAKLTADG
jgi:hypothetical protein